MAETSVVLQRTRGREALVALFSALATYGCGLMLAQRWADGLAQSLGGGQTLVWALRGVLAIFLVEFLTDSLAAVWRLVDRRPFIEADAAGLRFHPSLHPSLVPWSEVKDLMIQAGALNIGLRRRFWSLDAWSTSRRIRAWLPGLNASREAVAQSAARMEAWRRGETYEQSPKKVTALPG